MSEWTLPAARTAGVPRRIGQARGGALEGHVGHLHEDGPHGRAIGPGALEDRDAVKQIGLPLRGQGRRWVQDPRDVLIRTLHKRPKK